MEKILIIQILVGIIMYQFCHLTDLHSSNESSEVFTSITIDSLENELKNKSFEILNSKCNICQRKQNPFKIFKLKNMDKYAPRIYQQVFIKKRMPKGDQIKLTDKEYQTLNGWHNGFRDK